jgi:hypothetical protein
MTTTTRGKARVRWHDRVPDAVPAGHDVLVSDELVLEPEPRNVAVARDWVAARVPLWADDDARSAVALLTSELVTNGIVHARTTLRLGMAVTDSDVVIGVHDLDLGHAEAAGSDRQGGWGLIIVRETAAGSGRVQHPGGGKTVWFRVSA